MHRIHARTAAAAGLILATWTGSAWAQPPDASGAANVLNRAITIAGEVVRGTVQSIDDQGVLGVELPEGELRVRLWAIATPQDSGDEATEALAFLKRLVGDEVVLDLRHHTRSGVWHGIVLWAGQDVGESLVLSGLARYCPGRARLPYLESAERTARSQKRGLWSRDSPPACPAMKPHGR